MEVLFKERKHGRDSNLHYSRQKLVRGNLGKGFYDVKFHTVLMLLLIVTVRSKCSG
jgi:hypothetical protein